MTTLLTGHARRTRILFQAYSDEGNRRKRSGGSVTSTSEPACKRRANCLKPKEIWVTTVCFDLRQAANYLKVKTSVRGVKGGTGSEALPADMIAA